MKRKIYGLLAAVCLILAVAPSVRADDIVEYPVTGGTITFDKASGTVTGYKNDYSSYVTEATIPNKIDGVRVTSIGESAFAHSSLRSVTIPDSVITIGDCAFSKCISLAGVTISNGVTTIGNGAFMDCSNLWSVDIPNSVTTIGNYAFYYCSRLSTPNFPDSGVTTIGNYAFSMCDHLGSISFPDSLTTIGDYAFEYAGVTSVSIPNSVTSIGSSAFHKCTRLTSVSIPGSVTAISEGAFASCDSLTSVSIPNGVTAIGEEAFFYCTSLTSVSIPSSVTAIGEGAFGGCKNLKDVYYDGTETEYETRLHPNIENNDTSYGYDGSYHNNNYFLKVKFHFKEDTSSGPNPNPNRPTLPNTAASDYTALYGIIFLILAVLTLTVWALSRRKKNTQSN